MILMSIFDSWYQSNGKSLLRINDCYYYGTVVMSIVAKLPNSLWV